MESHDYNSTAHAWLVLQLSNPKHTHTHTHTQLNNNKSFLRPDNVCGATGECTVGVFP